MTKWEQVLLRVKVFQNTDVGEEMFISNVYEKDKEFFTKYDIDIEIQELGEEIFIFAIPRFDEDLDCVEIDARGREMPVVIEELAQSCRELYGIP